MLLDAMGPSLLGNILAGKGAIAKRQGQEISRAGKGAGYGNKKCQKSNNNKMDF